MDILLTLIRPRRAVSTEPDARLLQKYVERAAKYVPCTYREFASEAALFEQLERSDRRTSPFVILTDSRGKQMSTEEFAAALITVQDRGVQQVLLAIGPANGWTAQARERANLVIAFGRMTLPHELAAIVAAEQIYRALTIRAGHPYHLGH